MIRRLEGEIEERNQLIQGLAQDAQAANDGRGRTFEPTELEQINRARERITELVAQLDPLRESSRIALEARQRAEVINAEIERMRGRGNLPGAVEYRSAGAYVADLYSAHYGDRDAHDRLESFNRAAAHQTTADNPGLLPETIVSPIVNFVDTSRPICNSLGVQDLGTGSWSYARITQHTQVGKQAGEKTELASRKMTITKTPLGEDTFGGYLNVSKQDISRTSPGIVDQVLMDLAGQYAIATEAEAGTVMTAAATAGPVIPATPTAANIATAIYGAVGSVFNATKGQGTTVVALSPDQLGIIGPVFPFVNPQNAFSSGFSAAGMNFGSVGAIQGVTVIMSAGLAADTILVYSTAAVKAFERKYENMQVVEPSVWGVQVGYAGDFDCLVVEPTGIVRVTTA
jgi:HK97 family phage major capsid protein